VVDRYTKGALTAIAQRRKASVARLDQRARISLIGLLF
jgi:hypothetical protein